MVEILSYTRKSDLKIIVQECIVQYNKAGIDALHQTLHNKILMHKVKFPLLEFCAETLYTVLVDNSDHIALCDKIVRKKTIGGNVILGKLMQLHLNKSVKESTTKAAEYIADADDWYVSDIIGERVFGYGLLTRFDAVFPIVSKLSTHSSHWVVRSLGAGGHYAIKKGLDQENVGKLFQLLLSMTNTRDRQIVQGIGWAAKTTAKFHPSIIQHYQKEIDDLKIPNWFRRKIEIGLNRHAYAKAKRG